jgi:hypothetical protein
MNPLVRVSAVPGSPEQRLSDPEFLRDFDLVVAVGQPLAVARRACVLCAEAGVKFMAAAVRGAAGFHFVDLSIHTYKPKVRIEGEGQGGQATHAAAAAPPAPAVVLRQPARRCRHWRPRGVQSAAPPRRTRRRRTWTAAGRSSLMSSESGTRG